MPVVLITYYDQETKKLLVSHGLDYHTLETICLPPEPVENFGARYDFNLGMYVMDDSPEDALEMVKDDQ